MNLPDTGLETAGGPRVAIQARIAAAMPSLRPTEERVAQVVLERPDAVIYQSVSEIAEAAGTSTAAVVRFAQQLGLKGFHELKVALARDLAVADREPATDDDAADRSILERITMAGAASVRDAGRLVDDEAFEAAVELLAGAGRVLFLGVGTSAPLAQDAAYRFATIGVRAEAPADLHVQHVTARLLEPGDVCVAVSHSGSTREVIAAVEAARSAGARTVAITSFLRSPLTELSELSLTAGAREVSMRLEAMASRLAHMAVIDALIVAVAERDPERSQAALDLFAEVISEHRF